MLFANHLIIVRGGGDLGTGVVYRLHKAGFPVIVLELENPLVVRRRVALASAVQEKEVLIEDMIGRLVDDISGAEQALPQGIVPLLVMPDFNSIAGQITLPVSAVVDARMAKRNIDTTINQAPLVIGMGPGFTAGVDCHAVVETKRGHTLGRVIWRGSALPNTGSPGIIAGKGRERVLRAPAAGLVTWTLDIGDTVHAGQRMGMVNGNMITAPFDGIIRGLIAPGTDVPAGLKIGDVDARIDHSACFTISDKALAIGGGVLEAVLSFLSRRGDKVG